MSKRTRQYIGILAALAAYYLVHEGTHLLYALLTAVSQCSMRLFRRWRYEWYRPSLPGVGGKELFRCTASCEWAGILEASTACLSTVFF